MSNDMHSLDNATSIINWIIVETGVGVKRKYEKPVGIAGASNETTSFTIHSYTVKANLKHTEAQLRSISTQHASLHYVSWCNWAV